jgi:WD40-like Beta Propeller Repeat
MKIQFLIFYVLLVQAAPVCSQELQFEKPIRFGPQINSSVEEISPMMSSDGKTLYFVRAFAPQNEGGKFAGMDVWMSTKNTRGQWGPASNKIKPWNNKANNAVIGISNDNSVVFLLNSYSNKGGVAFSRRGSADWNEPKPIVVPGINTNDFVGYYMSPDQNVLLISMKDKNSMGEEDIYISLKDSTDNWSPPLNLGSSINTEGFEISPYLSADKKRLYFSSNGRSGFGDADIYYAERLYDSWTVWSQPKNLGNEINSPKFDSYFSIYGDSVGVFSSNRDSEFADIYRVKINIKKSDPLIFKEVINFLDEAEIKNLSVRNFQNTLVFSTGSELLASHREQLTALVSILSRNKDIRVRLFVKSTSGPDDRERFQARLLSVLAYLKDSGVEGARITFGTDSDNALSKDMQEAVLIRLYR